MLFRGLLSGPPNPDCTLVLECWPSTAGTLQRRPCCSFQHCRGLLGSAWVCAHQSLLRSLVCAFLQAPTAPFHRLICPTEGFSLAAQS